MIKGQVGEQGPKEMKKKSNLPMAVGLKGKAGATALMVVEAKADDAFSLTLTGLRVKAGQAVEFKNWEMMGWRLRQIQRGLQWCLGDWINYGEEIYGETYSQAVDATGFDVQTLMNISSVCRKVTMSRRREKLTFGHHEAVASLEPKDQDRVLAKAEKENWTVQQVRDAVKEIKRVARAVGDGVDDGKKSGPETIEMTMTVVKNYFASVCDAADEWKSRGWITERNP